MRRIEHLLIFNQLFNVLSSNLLAPVYTTYVKHLGGDLMTAGFAVAINAVVIGIVILISGRFAQKYHSERLELVIGYMLMMLAACGYLVIKTPEQLFFIQIISGFGLAIAQPSFNGSLSSVIKRGNYTIEWADYLGIAYFVIGIASMVAGIVAQNFGFNTLFYIMIASEGVSVIGAIYLYETSKKANADPALVQDAV